jgi:hypothetical protein
MFHQAKGTPFWSTDSACTPRTGAPTRRCELTSRSLWHSRAAAADFADVEELTFWEQIDGGVQYTNNRKFLTFFPLIVCVAVRTLARGARG